MTQEEADLKAFDDANPRLYNRATALRQAIEALSSYRSLSQAGGIPMTSEMDAAAVTIRAALDELESKRNELFRLETAASQARVKAWRESKAKE